MLQLSGEDASGKHVFDPVFSNLRMSLYDVTVRRGEETIAHAQPKELAPKGMFVRKSREYWRNFEDDMIREVFLLHWDLYVFETWRSDVAEPAPLPAAEYDLFE